MTTQTLQLPQQGTLRGQVMRLALPAVGEQFLNMLVGLSDTYLVGHISASAALILGYGTAAGLAGVGLANNVVWIVTTLFMAVGVGSTALIARAVGGREPEAANATLRQSILLGITMGVVGGLVMYFLAAQMMQLFGANEEVARLGVQFLHITAFSMPLASLMFVLNAALRGAGDTRTPLLIMLLVNSLNIAISWLFINGRFGLPTLGVRGAAWGMATARVVGGLIVLAVLLRGYSSLKLDRWPRPNLGILRRIVRIGVPTGAEQFVFQGALVIFARYVTHLGTVPFAAHNTVLTVESMSFLPGFGFGVAATTLVGQALGAQDRSLARRSGNEANFQAAIFMSIMGLLFMLFPHWFLGMMVDDPAVVAAGTLPLRMVGAIQPFMAANFVYAGALRGAGDTRWPLLVKLVAPWLVRLPLAMLLIPPLGLIGAWIAMCVDILVEGLLTWWRFRGNTWERIAV